MILLNVPPFCSTEYWAAVFQNGLGCTMGSLLGILISYLIYRASTAQNRRDRELLERNTHTSTRNYFSLLVRGMLTTLTQQLKNLTTFQKEIAADPTEYPLLHYSPMHEFRRVTDNQNLDRVLLAFTTLNGGGQQTINHFSNLINNADYITAQIDEVVKQMEKAQAFDHNRKKQLQSLYRELYSSINELLSKKGISIFC